jgi:hypothetical protein
LCLTNIIYRKARDTDKNTWKRCNYTYSQTTGNSGLRVHIENIHLEEFLRLRKERGWSAELPKMQKKALLAASIDRDGDGQGHNVTRPQFSEDTFLQHLINFIVADDQVCHSVTVVLRRDSPRFSQSIMVVECHKF